LNFVEIFGARKLKSLVYRVASFAWYYTFSHFSRTPTCDRQTDRQTYTRRRHINPPVFMWVIVSLIRLPVLHVDCQSSTHLLLFSFMWSRYTECRLL